MNCRSFESQAADWLGGRLSQGQARRMAGHQASCASCAHIAQAEARMREHWRAGAPPATPDLWPLIAARLEESERRPMRLTAPSPLHGRAMRPLAVMAVLGAAVFVFGLWHGVGPFPHRLPHGIVREMRSAGAPSAGGTASSVSLPTQVEVSLVDRTVDDPAGTDMDRVWAQLPIGVARTEKTGMEKK